MDKNENDNKWILSMEKLVLSLNIKIFISILVFEMFSIIFLAISFILYGNFSRAHQMNILISCCIMIFVLLVFIYFVSIVKTIRRGNIVGSIIILVFDLLNLYTFIDLSIEPTFKELSIRIFYYFICYMIMFMNFRSNHTSSLDFKLLMIYKFLLFVGVIIIYIHIGFDTKYYFVDFNMIILAFGLTIVHNLNMKTIIKSLEKLNIKNVTLTKQMKNMVNMMKNPMISINLRKLSFLINSSFSNFVKENFNNIGIDYKYLLGEVPEDNFLEMENKDDEVIQDNQFFQDLQNTIKTLKKKKKFMIFKRKLNILNQLLKSFSNLDDNDSTSKNETNEYFNLFYHIQQNKNLKEDEFYEKKQSFKLINYEKFYEVYFKKTLFTNEEEVVDIMLIDISSTRELEFTKDDINYRKIHFARIAHEFKTPINSLLSSIKDLVDNFQKNISKSNIINDFNFIEAQANFINILIQDINDFSKNLKDFQINLDKVDLKNVVNFSFQILKTLMTKDKFKNENVEIHLNINDNVPNFITTDERRLKQILVNLLSNSVKFTYFGHISINVKLKSDLNNNYTNEIEFYIEDTGVGISKQDQDNLFRDHSKINRDYKKPNTDGFGLGLSICKQIIERIGKDIFCVSDKEFTRFYFTIYDYVNKEIVIKSDTQKSVDTILINESNFLRVEKQDYLNSSSNLLITRENKILVNENKFKIPKICKTQRNVVNNEFKKNTEKILIELLESSEFSKYKLNFLNFIKPPLKYLRNAMKIKNLKIILVVENEKINIKSLKILIGNYIKDNKIINYKILILSDGIETLNLLYFDSIFFKKISTIIYDLNKKFLDGNTLLKLINQFFKDSYNLIKFVIYSNEDKKTTRDQNPDIQYYLRNPCTKEDIDNLAIEIGGF